jgi:tetratricopeptide (TPR) repeat protein
MNAMHRAALALVILAAASAAEAGSRSSVDKPISSTVIGPSNALLADGAAALEEGRADDGIRLTLEGLKLPAPPRDMAAGHANLCAGYVLLHQWDEALAHCNTAIALDGSNWRAYNNRAAVFDARGLYDQAIGDVETGLRIAPNSTILRKSLKIIYANKKVSRTRSKKASDA